MQSAALRRGPRSFHIARISKAFKGCIKDFLVCQIFIHVKILRLFRRDLAVEVHLIGEWPILQPDLQRFRIVETSASPAGIKEFLPRLADQRIQFGLRKDLFV